MDLTQQKQKYSQFNMTNKDNNAMNKNSYYYSPKKKPLKKNNNVNEFDDSHSNENDNALDSNINKNIINLNESEENENQNDYENSNEEYSNSYNKSNNRHRRYNPRDNNIIKQKETNLKEKGCELFIGNLNISTEKEDLNKLFRPFGNITDIRLHKNDENKKCYAFVRYSTKEMANNALKLDSTLLNNRHIKVTKSNENATIFIGNIRKTWTQEELETKIRRIFHNINKIEFFTDPLNPTKNRGFCFGIFNTRNEAIKALNYVNKKGGINIDGISITCDWADVVDDDDNSKSNQIFISNIKKEVQENDLKNYFNRFAKVINVIMSKNHINSKRKDLVFITFETHEDAVTAIKRFEDEKKNIMKVKDLKRIFLLGENENINMIQVSLAFSQEAMQNKKKIKDNRKKVPSNSGNSNNTSSNNPNGGNSYNKGNNNNKNSSKQFIGNLSSNSGSDYKNNYNNNHSSKSYQKHEAGNNSNNLNNNKNVHDLLSTLNNNKLSYRKNNTSMNYSHNNNNNKNNQMNNHLFNQLNQLFTNSIDQNNMNKNVSQTNMNNINNFINNNNNNTNVNNQNINNNFNQNQLLLLTNLINLCQQNPSLLQQMNTTNMPNLYNANINNKSEVTDINSEKKFINRKRNNSNNNYMNNINNNLNTSNNYSTSNNNELQNNNYLNIPSNQTQNQNIISQFPYIQNNSSVSPINNSNVPNIPNIQNLQNIISTIPNNPNFNTFSKYSGNGASKCISFLVIG